MWKWKPVELFKKDSKERLVWFLSLFEATVPDCALNIMIFMLNLGPGRGINLNQTLLEMQ